MIDKKPLQLDFSGIYGEQEPAPKEATESEIDALWRKQWSLTDEMKKLEKELAAVEAELTALLKL